ncbi:baculoviral IAP repeat-containing protein 5b isoform X2 [Ictalurus punctatus]|uniref:Baculoviral IAP repeat-containing protein 5b isoform X2 n=1 Tax=Ictalurus punctatus TaxID=7998 RepID=A0A2D0SHL1_ICTPU|nr:baculoviral IAP repeat-containing protein 5b isoform X2 [Ictalurus punctatus]
MNYSDVIAARFLTFDQMYSYEKRLQTFADWPFREDCQCTPEQMAKAGFVHCPSENEPDVACCFYCLKELEGWEPEDIPWFEHAKRSPDCGFLQMKSPDELTAVDFFRLEHGRMVNYLRKMAHMKIAYFRDQVDVTSRNLRLLFEILPHGGSVMQGSSLDPCNVMRGALNPSSICSAFPQILTKSCRRLTELNK